jgi:RNA polymerase sigma-70 factor (ECF subfamily)
MKRDGASGGDVRPVGRGGVAGDDEALVDAPYLRRVLARVLGADDELADVLHETFAQVFASVDSLDDPKKLKGWLVRVAVFTARGVIRKRRRKRWLRFGAPETLPETQVATQDVSGRAALQAVSLVLDAMPEKERLAFTLRYFEGMQLLEVADACDVSLATIKRHLAKAENRFVVLARAQPVLRDWLDRSRWTEDAS